MKKNSPDTNQTGTRIQKGTAMLLAVILLLSGCGAKSGQEAASGSVAGSASQAGSAEKAAETAAVSDGAADASRDDAEENPEGTAAEATDSTGISSLSGSTGEEAAEPAAETAAGPVETNSQTETGGSEEMNEQPSRDPAVDALVEAKLTEMSLDQKIAQMFVILPEALTGTGTVTAVDESVRDLLEWMPVGGICYMQPNLTSAWQTQEMLSTFEQYSQEVIGLPMFSFVDEEGGDITRISGNPGFPEIPWIDSMQNIGATGNINNAFQTGTAIGGYLAELGFNGDFAPVADVLSNPYNEIVRTRSFGDDPQLVSDMALALAGGLESQGILPVFKHFPGHGATAGDTHAGYAYTDKTLEELMECELIPFRKAIDNGAEFIMVSHISLPNVTGDDTPASLSSVIITDLLRDQMDYDGIVITDAMNMGAIVDTYGFEPAAVKAIEAGVDIVLLTGYLDSTREAVKQAVADGTIPEEQINTSVRRILRVKYELQRNKYGIEE